MRRGCLIVVFVLLFLCIAGTGFVYFFAVPRVRDNAQEGVRNAIGTQVAEQIPIGLSNVVEPGSYSLTAAELQQTLRDNVSVSSLDDIVIRIDQAGLELGIISNGSESKYTGLPTLQDGKLVMENMSASDRYLEFIFPAQDLGDAVEEAINGYLTANNLKIEKLTLVDGEILLETIPLA